MACRLDGAKPLSEPMPENCLLDTWDETSAYSKYIHFHSRKCIRKYRLVNGRHFVSVSMCFNGTWTILEWWEMNYMSKTWRCASWNRLYSSSVNVRGKLSFPEIKRTRSTKRGLYILMYFWQMVEIKIQSPAILPNTEIPLTGIPLKRVNIMQLTNMKRDVNYYYSLENHSQETNCETVAFCRQENSSISTIIIDFPKMII